MLRADAARDRAGGEFIESKDKGAKTFGGAKYEALPDAERDEILFELLPWLRGQLSHEKRMIATFQGGPAILRFVNSRDARRLAELGTSCPDHFLRITQRITKPAAAQIRPLCATRTRR